uniref:Uncharacterized protein n=1 Tax=Mycena chlorophos TaxID=658473 RepID=A0ABQ0LFT8_MYCCL|nr:predicted protein [Mycena chlorophos]
MPTGLNIAWLLVGLLLGIIATAYHTMLVSAVALIWTSAASFLTPVLLLVYAVLFAVTAVSVSILADRVDELEEEVRRAQPRQVRDTNLRPGYDSTGNLVAIVRKTNVGPSSGPTPIDDICDLPPLRVRSAAPARTAQYRKVTTGDWDGWPDGHLEYHFSAPDLVPPGSLDVFWVLEPTPGARGGSWSAVTAAGGKIYRAKCRGMLTCSNERCIHRLCVAPDVSLKNILRQLLARCICGEPLTRVLCGTECTLCVFRDGAVVTHHGEHRHPKYTHTLIVQPNSTRRPTLSVLTSNDVRGLLPPQVHSHFRSRALVTSAPSVPDTNSKPVADEPSVDRSLSEAEAAAEDWDEAEQRELQDDPTADERLSSTSQRLTINDNCTIIVRPLTKSKARTRQLAQGCRCGSALHWHKCGSISKYYIHSTGVHYVNGAHRHPRPPNERKLTPGQSLGVALDVRDHPDAGPAQLMAGVHAVGGPGKSSADRNPLLLNPKRMGYERRKALEKLEPGYRTRDTHFEPEMEAFKVKHPDWTINVYYYTDFKVVVLQSPFMRQLSVKDPIEEEAVNGVVSDAAHNYFKGRNNYLFVSSGYEPEFLRSYVPLVFSYSEGASAAHYVVHFRQLFAGMVQEWRAMRPGEPIPDSIFANVLDFSEAERLGLIEAFVEMRLSQDDDHRTEAELREAAQGLIKGCERHFREQVERVSKISRIVPPTQRQHFRNRVLELLDCKTSDIFRAKARALIHDFPLLEPWLSWWLRPEHAAMLFRSELVMDLALFFSLPATTNAEESMHHRFYSLIKRLNALFEGLEGLIRAAELFHQQYLHAKHGGRITYGQGEPWKRTSEVYGRTHHSRGHVSTAAERADSRPPDRAVDLVPAAPSARRASIRKPVATTITYQLSYPWFANSCWLDSSLTALFAVSLRDWTSMVAMLQPLAQNQPLNWILRILVIHRDEAPLPKPTSPVLRMLRNEMKELMVSSPIIRGYTAVDQFYSPYVCEATFYEMASKASVANPVSLHRAISVFRPQIVQLHKCLGDPNGGEHSGPHWQIDTPRAGRLPQLLLSDYQKYDGRITRWFKGKFLHSSAWEDTKCWRTHNTTYLCNGPALIHSFVLTLPLILQIEFSATGCDWHIPDELLPLDKTFGAAGVRYELVAHIYTNGTHFTTRYVDLHSRIFDYDGMDNAGRAMHRSGSSFKTYMTGKFSNILEMRRGYRVYGLTYRLVGGERAQELFRVERQKKFPLGIRCTFDPALNVYKSAELRRRNLELLPNAIRHWYTSRKQARFKEYRETQAKATAPKKKKAVARAKRATRRDSDGDSDELSDSPELPSSSGSEIDAKPPAAGTEQLGVPPNLLDSWRPVVCVCGSRVNGFDTTPKDDLVQCMVCENFSHHRCLPSGTDWRLGDIKLRCHSCLVRSLQVEAPALPVGAVRFQRQNLAEPADSDTAIWAPAEYLGFSGSRYDMECEWRWVPDVQADHQPLSASFYRPREDVELPVGRGGELRSSQIPHLNVPRALELGIADAASPNPALSLACIIAVPQIIDRINETSSRHPIVLDFDEDHAGRSSGMDIDVLWLRRRGLVTSSGLDPGLLAVFAEPLRILAENRGAAHGIPLLDMAADALGVPRRASRVLREISGPWERAVTIAAAFWISLCVQHELGEDWDLSGLTYLEFTSGNLIEEPAVTFTRQTIHALTALYLAPDSDLSSHFHWTRDDTVVFATRRTAPPTNILVDPNSPRTLLRHNGRVVRRASELPDIRPPAVERKVRFNLPPADSSPESTEKRLRDSPRKKMRREDSAEVHLPRRSARRRTPTPGATAATATTEPPPPVTGIQQVSEERDPMDWEMVVDNKRVSAYRYAEIFPEKFAAGGQFQKYAQYLPKL